MKKNICCLVISFLILGCNVDYDPTIERASECLIVNALLQPDKPITVHLNATQIINNTTKIVSVQTAHVVIKENETILYNGDTEGLVQLDAYPKEGYTYSIEVRSGEYPDVKAGTTIPYKIDFGFRDRAGGIYSLFDFNFPEIKSAMWITFTAFFTGEEPNQFEELYCNNSLVDNFNREEGSDLIAAEVGSGYHGSFLRVKAKNLSSIDSVVVHPAYGSTIIDDNLERIEIRVIAASKEYDQYCKTYYQQLNIPASDDALIWYQPINVYSNIKGGLGIFAGKVETVCFDENINK